MFGYIYAVSISRACTWLHEVKFPEPIGYEDGGFDIPQAVLQNLRVPSLVVERLDL